MSTIITENITIECLLRFSMRPYISTSENGKSIIATQERKFVRSVGLSNGWAVFRPLTPPPLGPNWFIDTNAANGWTTMVCCLGCPLSAVPIAVSSSVETGCALAKVIGAPCCRKINASAKETGRNVYITTRHISTKKFPMWGSLRKALIIAVRPQKPIEADRKKFVRQEQIWLKLEKC